MVPVSAVQSWATDLSGPAVADVAMRTGGRRDGG